jgi:hypothetical protein
MRTDREPTRDATGMVPLRGGTGEIIASDGHRQQMLVQAGFQFS